MICIGEYGLFTNYSKIKLISMNLFTNTKINMNKNKNLKNYSFYSLSYPNHLWR